MYITTGNAKAGILTRNIRCKNGMLHIVDTLLMFPYETVAETMGKHTELR